jgi:hypothetical protein
VKKLKIANIQYVLLKWNSTTLSLLLKVIVTPLILFAENFILKIFSPFQKMNIIQSNNPIKYRDFYKILKTPIPKEYGFIIKEDKPYNKLRILLFHLA